MNKKNTLPRLRETALPLAVSLIRKSTLLTQVRPGVVMRLRIENKFKAVVHWFSEEGDGEELLKEMVVKERRPPLHDELFIVKKAKNTFGYLWARYKLGNGYYLTEMRISEGAHFAMMLSANLRRFKTREIMLD
ncbi:hypothetical protein [Xanthomonas phage RTH11]|nr:hypothetical protein [Xanthomonas phage RTH11]